MIETKEVRMVKISPQYVNKISANANEKKMLQVAKKALGGFEDLCRDLEHCWNTNEVLTFKDSSKMLYPKLNLIMDKKEAGKLDISEIGSADLNQKMKKGEIENFGCELLSDEEAKAIYFEYSSASRSHNYTQILCKSAGGKIGYLAHGAFIVLDTKKTVDGGMELFLTGHPAIFRSMFNQRVCVRVPICFHFPAELTKLEVIVKYNLRPAQMQETALMNNLIFLIKKGYVKLENGKISLTKSGEMAVVSGECKMIANTDLQSTAKNMEGEVLQDVKVSKLETIEKKMLFEYYLKCDFYRANMREYDLKRIEDPNLGHWELWDGNELDDLSQLGAKECVIARNPEADIQEDSIVGIDFGTKSTVVVYQNESGRIKPMPMGCGDIRKELISDDFENPTVMQFINLKSFVQSYNEKKGRPYTKWKDLTVSHAANESMKDTGVRSDEFYSFLYDLKQWAGEGSQKTIIRDKCGKDTLLAPYGEIIDRETDETASHDVIDPIEIYAYYIGLYVNNMNNGIYLDYLLSFPVTYEKHIRDAILKSFKRGLLKSLPQSIQDDERVILKFKVEAGASEPAAYAICALEKYGFDPKPGEKVFYGIFDFGGGTADFDFGLWTASENEDVYDYRIEHFGSEGDRYLGGENLLQLIAFEAFLQNLELCRKENITFSKPIEYVNVPVEVKGYVNNSQEARTNLKLMMEKLRPFWERSNNSSSDEANECEDFSEFQVGLFDAEGKHKPNLPFEVNVQKLEEILTSRIEKGVRQFFNALKGTFDNKHIAKTLKVDHINIFLAGNSSKSPILHKIFEEKISDWSKEIEGSSEKDSEESFFSLYPPLGSQEALEIQERMGVTTANELESPTGKTGVAWGLIEGRKGGRIEIIEEISADTEAKFAYYLGISRRKKFSVKISRDCEYGKWYRFIPAVQERFEIVYTSLPEATNGDLSESDEGVMRKRLSLSSYGDGKYVCIRLVGREKVEYTIGDAEGNIDEEMIVEVDL